MYKVCIYNNNTETVIHYPTSDQEAPHLNKLDLKEGLSMVDSLSFVLYPNNPGYSNIFELTTKVKVIDTRDNSIRFTGRVLDAYEKMDSNGLFYKEVTCEGALSYLNDSKQRANSFITANPTDFLTQILAIHNSKVDESKQIQIGNVDITGNVAYTCNFETTLAAILKVREKLGGDIRVREENGVLYLDWLQNISNTTVGVILGENMKDMIKQKDVTELGTRIIPLGANNLTISSVNGGLDYIEDTNAINAYGVIEKIVEYRDITEPMELKTTALADLSKYTQPKMLLEAGALDLSYLTGNTAEQFTLGANLHIVNPIMNVNSIFKIVQIELDLLQPYNPKLTIANFPVKLSTTINDLRKITLQRDGVYNGVQVGDNFGIRIVRSDGNVVTTLNATEGISIETPSGKVFFVDTNGNLIAKQMRTNNTQDYMILEDQFINIYKNGIKQVTFGFTDYNGQLTPVLFLGRDDFDDAWFAKLADGSAEIGNSNNFLKYTKIQFSADDETINIDANNVTHRGQNIATQSWVLNLLELYATWTWVIELMNSHIQEYHSN